MRRNPSNIAVHMAKSVEYKNVYPGNTDLENTLSTIDNISDDLQSKADDYMNGSNAKSVIEEKTGVNVDDAKNTVDQYAGKLPF